METQPTFTEQEVKDSKAAEHLIVLAGSLAVIINQLRAAGSILQNYRPALDKINSRPDFEKEMEEVISRFPPEHQGPSLIELKETMKRLELVQQFVPDQKTIDDLYQLSQKDDEMVMTAMARAKANTPGAN